MKLLFNELTIENFGCFSGQHSFLLRRDPGLYFISGHNISEPSLTSNGCGKSTLFNALFWCLTGKTLRSLRPGSSIESWHSKSTLTVTLQLEIDSHIHHVTRTRKPNTLMLDGRTVDQKIIDDIIKLNEETLKRTIFVGQFVPMFLDLRPEYQSSLFSEALNLDLWLAASDKAASEYKRCETQIGKHELSKAALAGRLDQLHEQYEIEMEREKTFDIDHKKRRAEVGHSLVLVQAELASSETALRAAQTPESVDPGNRDRENALRATRALERDLMREDTELVATARAWHRELELITSSLRRYEAAKESCPECGQIVNQAHIDRKASELRQQHGELIEDIGNAEQHRFIITDKINKARKTCTKLEGEIQVYRAEYQTKQEAFQKVKRHYDITSYRVRELTRELEDLSKATNPYTKSCEQLAEAYFEIENQVKTTDELLTELNETSSIYKYWVSAYREIRLNLIDETLQELEIATNRHMQALGLNDWQIEFRTVKENKSGTITHTFTTLIYPNGQANPIPFDSYSGGESQRLQLAVTTALSEILLDRAGVITNIEILDEPSRHLSQEGITDLLECLKQRAMELNRCIYFIDHNSLESTYFDRIITIEKRNSGSRILV